ncbi:lamin tail domain-containing protein [bacterium]|nr:lamin tail domain-containing protein [bacterium]
MYRVFLFFFILSQCPFSQVNESWEDSDFTSNPVWQGTTDLFSVSTDDKKLQLTAPKEAGKAWLYTESMAIENAQWELDIETTFNPSSSNYCLVYLVANQAEFNNYLQGYFVKIGGTEDEVSLYYQDDNSSTKIIDGINDRIDVSSVSIRIRVTRDKDGQWELFSNIGDGEVKEGVVFHDEIKQSQFFGLYCKYTSTRNEGFFFDDIIVSGEAYSDVAVPEIISHLVNNCHEISVQFSKPIDSVSLLPNHFLLTQYNTAPIELEFQETGVVLKYSEGFPDLDDSELKITNITDLAGNAMNDTLLILNYKRVFIDSVECISDSSFLVSFTKNIDSSSVQKNDFQLLPEFEYPKDVSLISDHQVEIVFDKRFASPSNLDLEIRDIADVVGDTIFPASFSILYFLPQIRDLVIDESWDDNDFINNPEWQGTTDLFTVTTDDNKLQLTAPAEAGKAWLFTESNSIDSAQWEFDVETTFNTSSSNYCLVYLVANQNKYNDSLQGYFVKIGGNEDEISLYYQDDNSSTKIIDGTDDRVNMSAIAVHIKVTRNEDAQWELFSNIGDGEVNEGAVFHDKLKLSHFFGLYCKYTSTRNEGFFFDEIAISGKPYFDTDAPEVLSYNVKNCYEISVQFSERIDSASLLPNHFLLTQYNTAPDELEYQDAGVILKYPEGFPDLDDSELKITNITDLGGNAIRDTLLVLNYKRVSIDSVECISDSSFVVYFTKDIDFTSVQKKDFQLLPEFEYPKDVSLISDHQIEITFNKRFASPSDLDLEIRDIADVRGDTIFPTSVSIRYFLPQIRDLVIDESWEDNDFINNPEWQGTTDLFTVTTDDKKLQLTAPAEAGKAWLFTESNSIENAQWEFDVKTTFNSSSSNYCLIYLVANQAEFNESLQGYFVKIGGNEDEVSLYYQDGNSSTKIIDGTDARVDMSEVSVRIKVTRDKDGQWELFSNIGDGEVKEGAVFHDKIKQSQYFGICCHYTSTRNEGFFFDEIAISGEPYSDTDAPEVLTCDVNNCHEIAIQFSELIDSVSLLPNHFFLTQYNTVPDELIYQDAGVVLKYSEGFPDLDDSELKITNITDLIGNTIKDTLLVLNYKRVSIDSVECISDSSFLVCFTKDIDFTSVQKKDFQLLPGFEYPTKLSLTAEHQVEITFDKPFTSPLNLNLEIRDIADVRGDTIVSGSFSFFYYLPHRGDVVINELMIDPTPSVGWFEDEFLEIYNNTSYPISLNNWELWIDDKTTIIPDFELQAESHLVLSSTDSIAWGLSSKKCLQIPLPALRNAGGEIVLKNKRGEVIDAISYPFNYSQFGFKEDGGWSLERIDVNNFQVYGDNWDFSTSINGATPGLVNSIAQQNKDVDAPQWITVELLNSQTIEISFSEAINQKCLSDVKYYSFSNPLIISHINWDSAFQKKAQLIFDVPLLANQVHQLILSNKLIDRAGNSIFNNDTIRFGWPSPLDSSDLVINEILFNPVSEGVDFVEIYNRSSKIISMDEVYLSSLSAVGVPEVLFKVVSLNRVILPGEYWTFCEDTTALKNTTQVVYPRKLIQCKIPSLPDNEGSIAITNSLGQIIDALIYTDDLHFSLLNSDEGVSLERIDYQSSTQNKNNWHSASGPVGYATPTAQNSQFRVTTLTKNSLVSLQDKVFSPNGDGYQDVLKINYSFDEAGWVGTVKVFNVQGQLVKELVNNELLGSHGFFTWDGTNSHHQKARVGNYIIWVQLFSNAGKVENYKLVCTLSGSTVH